MTKAQRKDSILIVDDSVEVRSLLAEILSRSGYFVYQSSDPIEALRQLRSRGEFINLVLTDVYMPGMTGIEFLKEIKEPLAARILSVADTYDAMTSTRPYRLAKDSGETVAELLKYSNIQFDRDVVMAFIRTNARAENSSQQNM